VKSHTVWCFASRLWFSTLQASKYHQGKQGTKQRNHPSRQWQSLHIYSSSSQSSYTRLVTHPLGQLFPTGASRTPEVLKQCFRGSKMRFWWRKFVFIWSYFFKSTEIYESFPLLFIKRISSSLNIAANCFCFRLWFLLVLLPATISTQKMGGDAVITGLRCSKSVAQIWRDFIWRYRTRNVLVFHQAQLPEIVY